MPNGLAKSHAYTILDVRIVQGKDKKIYRIVKVRNPWSSEIYNGKANDNDSQFWNAKLRKELNHYSADDGLFWITIEEFYKSMLYVIISYYHKGWYHNYYENLGDDGLMH